MSERSELVNVCICKVEDNKDKSESPHTNVITLISCKPAIYPFEAKISHFFVFLAIVVMTSTKILCRMSHQLSEMLIYVAFFTSSYRHELLIWISRYKTVNKMFTQGNLLV